MAKLGDLFPDNLPAPAKTPAGRARPVVIASSSKSNKPTERVCIKDLAAGHEVESVYLVSEAVLRSAKNGSKYVQATFCDKTGTIPVRQWDADDVTFGRYKVAGYVKVRGRVELYKNALQLIAFAVEECPDSAVNAADFIPVSVRPLDEMERELDALIASFTDADYKRLLVAIFADADIRARFVRNPAAASVHHAWRGGLIEHVLSACKTAQSIAEQRPFLNRDLLMTGVILHDIGKIEELDPGPGFTYTDTGRLCGHIVLGTLLVDRVITKLGDFPKKKRDIILHMILSHHGTHEFGSPVTPLTAEAVALHHLECMDAKVQGIQTIIERENAAGNDSPWTEFARVVDGRIYKG